MTRSTSAFFIFGVLAFSTGASEAPATKKPASPAAASKKNKLSPAAEKFIRSIGLDPQSPDVKLSIEDGTIETLRTTDEPMSSSLETLAKAKNKSGAINFVKTRVVIHKLKTDFAGTPFEKNGGFDLDAAYLTVKERRLLNQKLFPDLH